MALIRCPSCDTLHDLEGSFFAAGPRKVRCASCRTVWEASNPESPGGPNLVIPTLTPRASPPTASPDAVLPDPGEPDAVEATAEAALNQSAIDAMDFGAMPAGADEGAEAGADISADELEALFADAAPPASEPPVSDKPEEDVPEFDPKSLARAQDADLPPQDPEERRRLRRKMRLDATEAHHKHVAQAPKSRPVAAMAMAAGLGTLATLGFLHNEVSRLFPASAPLFEAVGLGQNNTGLDISDVRSRLIREDNREILEVSGVIANTGRASRKIPVLRLSIRAAAGQEIYVWTASADRMELVSGEKTRFTRRLASPPQGAHSVLVRFVARDDIVAAIR